MAKACGLYTTGKWICQRSLWLLYKLVPALNLRFEIIKHNSKWSSSSSLFLVAEKMYDTKGQ